MPPLTQPEQENKVEVLLLLQMKYETLLAEPQKQPLKLAN